MKRAAIGLLLLILAGCNGDPYHRSVLGVSLHANTDFRFGIEVGPCPPLACAIMSALLIGAARGGNGW